MSVSSLPEWKQLLLERKRREEEAREQREKQEEQKLANMPAWKRGIIQRRKAKQESPADGCHVEARSPSDGLSDTDSSVTVNLGSDVSTSPDPGMWLDGDSNQGSQVSVETIVPVNENPFIRTQKKKGREGEMCSPKSYDGEADRGRDFEIKMEKFRDLSEGRDKEQSSRQREACQETCVAKEKDRNQRRQNSVKVKKEDEDREADPASPACSPVVPCLRTIRADNIIIIEQERKSKDERRNKWREAERSEEEIQSKRGLKMDLKEILAGGGSVTEIRASEVLIIKPPPEDRVKNREDGDKTEGKREGRELRSDMSWLKDKVKDSVKEKERPWGQATVIKEDKKENSDDSVFVDKGGRVSQLLSKFGEHHRKPPSRSKSSENLKPPPNVVEDFEEDEREDRRNEQLKGVPKRSFSFSDRAFTSKENGYEEEVRLRDRIHSEKAHWTEVASLGRDNAGRIKMGCARLLERDRLAKHRHWQSKEKPSRDIIDGDEGFTVASVRNVEGIAFAKRVPIRQEGRSRDREARREQTLAVEKETNSRCDSASKESQGFLCSGSGTGPTLFQQKEERLGERPYKTAFEAAKNFEGGLSKNTTGNTDARTSTRTPTTGLQPSPVEIQIPRTVFYVAEETVEKRKAAEDWDDGREMDNGDSWKARKPVSRVESLKGKIRQQQQQENVTEKEAGAEEDPEVLAAVMNEALAQQEAESEIGKSRVEAEKEGADEALQATNVTQEVNVSKTSPQLPDSQSEAEEGEEVIERGVEITTESSRPESDTSEEDGNAERDRVNPEESLQEEEKEFTEEDLKELTGNFDSEESLSPSPTDPHSLEVMSRIYNLETVGSRSGLCLRDKSADMPPVHLIKIKHLSSQKGESIQSIQRQIENLKLKEQEAQATTNSTHSSKGVHVKEEGESKKEDGICSPQMSPKRFHSPDQTIEINSAMLRCQSPENALKILDLAPTPVSSPCSPSPAQSPNESPSLSPTPTALFTLKSALGGQVKRGATITITPKKAQGSTAATKTSPSPKAPASAAAEPGKKKYPTVEEIEVIGGYLNLDKSCLVKNRGTPKKVKVCFSEERLEQLCEYPSETSMWAGSPYPHDLEWTDTDLDLDEDVQMETVSLPKATRSVGTATGRGLKMGTRHPLLKKHSV